MLFSMERFVFSIQVASESALKDLLNDPPPGYHVHHTIAIPLPMKSQIREIPTRVDTRAYDLVVDCDKPLSDWMVVVIDVTVGYRVVYELAFTHDEMAALEMEYEERAV